MTSLVVYTDGSCHPNPNGFGGWAFIVVSMPDEIEVVRLSGCELLTTNNRMEVLPIINAVRWLKNNEQWLVENVSDRICTIKADSTVAIGWASKLRTTWPDLTRQLVDLANETIYTRIVYEHVKGHAGHFWNEECDKLANVARKQLIQDNSLGHPPPKRYKI